MNYQRVVDLHEDDESLLRHSGHASFMSYELPEHHGSLSS